MFKVLLLAIFTLFLNAETIHFQEEKYIEVVGNSFYKKGTLEFKNNSIKLQYNNSNKVLKYQNDTLTLLNEGQEEPIDQNVQTMLKMVFLLIQSIYYDDMETLKDFFTIKLNQQEIELLPKENLSSYIKTIHFRKNSSLEYLSIKMQNGNITTIKQIDE